MTTFILERKVDSPDLQEAFGQFQQEFELSVPIIEPSVILFTKRMARRVDNLENHGLEAITNGLNTLATYTSPDISLNLGTLSVQGGKRTGVERCGGFPIVKGERRGIHPKRLLLEERAAIADCFGIRLFADEKEPESLLVPAFRLKDTSLDERKNAFQTWQSITRGKSFRAKLLNLKLTTIEG